MIEVCMLFCINAFIYTCFMVCIAYITKIMISIALMQVCRFFMQYERRVMVMYANQLIFFCVAKEEILKEETVKEEMVTQEQ